MRRAERTLLLALPLLFVALALTGGGNSIPRAVPRELEASYLPESWEPDDDNGLDDAIRFLHQRTIQPGDFIQAVFPKYYVAAAYALVWRDTGEDLAARYRQDPERFVRTAYRVAFLISALLCAATIVAIYAAARVESSVTGALSAALVAGLNTSLLTHAHFAVFDMHLLLFETLLLLLLIRPAAAPQRALIAGITAAVKYTGIFFAPLLWLVPRLRDGSWPGFRSSLRSLIFLALGFLVVGVSAVIYLSSFVHDLGVIFFTRSVFKGFVGGPRMFLMHWAHLFNAGPYLFLLAAAGGLYATLTRRRTLTQSVGILAFLLYYVFSGWSRLDGGRFTLPLVPPLALLAAPLVDRILASAYRRAAAVMLAIGFVVSFAACVETDWLFYRDSRIAARRFIDLHETSRSVTFSRPCYVQPALPEGRSLYIRLSQPPAPQPPLYYRLQSAYRRLLGRPPAPPPEAVTAPHQDHYRLNLDALRSAAPDFVVLSSFDTRRFLEQPVAFPETTRFLQDLISGRLGYDPVARFEARTWLVRETEFVNPEIVVLRRASPPGR